MATSKHRPVVAKRGRSQRATADRPLMLPAEVWDTRLSKEQAKARAMDGPPHVPDINARTGVFSIEVVVSSGGGWETVHRTRGLERIAMIHEGVQAKTLRGLADRVNRPVAELSRSLGLAPSTMRRKAKDGERLSTSDSERVLGFVSLIGQVDEMLGVDRPADFDAATWVARWVQEPHPALGGRQPDEMLDTTTGQSLVSDLLAGTASGSYW